MNTQTLTALKGSIKKWQNIVRSTKEVDKGTGNCPLCLSLRCIKCPVMDVTKQSGCQETPYIVWVTHLRDVHNHLFLPRQRVPYCKECLKIAKSEVSFLQSLLPGKEEK